MKKNLCRFVVLLVLPFALLFSGCDSTSSSIAGSDNPIAFFSAKVEGELWSFSPARIRVFYKQPIFMDEPRCIMIDANCESGNMKLAFDEHDLRIGTHTLRNLGWYDDIDNGAAYLFTRHDEKSYDTFSDAAGGTFTITTLTPKEIAGTFEFAAQDINGPAGSGPLVHITEGKFRIKLPQ
jgi:hypothetical protein